MNLQKQESKKLEKLLKYETETNPIHIEKKLVVLTFDAMKGLSQNIERVKLFYKVFESEVSTQPSSQSTVLELEKRLESKSLTCFTKTYKVGYQGNILINEMDRLTETRITNKSYLYIEVRVQLRDSEQKVASILLGFSLHKFLFSEQGRLLNGTVKLPVFSHRLNPTCFFAKDALLVKKPCILNALILLKIDYPNSSSLSQNCDYNILNKDFLYQKSEFVDEQIGSYQEAALIYKHLQQWATSERQFVSQIQEFQQLQNAQPSSAIRQMNRVLELILRPLYHDKNYLQKFLASNNKQKHNFVNVYTILQRKNPKSSRTQLSEGQKEILLLQLLGADYVKQQNQKKQQIFVQKNNVSEVDGQKSNSRKQQTTQQQSQTEQFKRCKWKINLQGIDGIDKDDQQIYIGFSLFIAGRSGIIRDTQGKECYYESDKVYKENNGAITIQQSQSFTIDFENYPQDTLFVNIYFFIEDDHPESDNEEEEKEEYKQQKESQIFGWALFPLSHVLNKNSLITGQQQMKIFKPSKKPITFPFDESEWEKLDQIVFFLIEYEQLSSQQE